MCLNVTRPWNFTLYFRPIKSIYRIVAQGVIFDNFEKTKILRFYFKTLLSLFFTCIVSLIYLMTATDNVGKCIQNFYQNQPYWFNNSKPYRELKHNMLFEYMDIDISIFLLCGIEIVVRDRDRMHRVQRPNFVLLVVRVILVLKDANRINILACAYIDAREK